MKNKNKGITLVALIVTIIILLILAGISIASLTGSGLFEKAKLAKEKSENSQKIENEILDGYEGEISDYISGTRINAGAIKVVSAWEGDNNIGTISLGDYNISDYDFIYLLAGYSNESKQIFSSVYWTKDIVEGTSIVGTFNDGRALWYEITNDNTLTYRYGDNNVCVLKAVRLIKL